MGGGGDAAPRSRDGAAPQAADFTGRGELKKKTKPKLKHLKRGKIVQRPEKLSEEPLHLSGGRLGSPARPARAVGTGAAPGPGRRLRGGGGDPGGPPPPPARTSAAARLYSWALRKPHPRLCSFAPFLFFP